MTIISEKTGKHYNTPEECLADEKRFDEELAAKEAKKNNIGEYDPEELFFIVEGELAYCGAIDDEE